MTDAVQARPADEPLAAARPAQFRSLLAGLLIAMSLASLDQSVVNTAMPRIASDLNGLRHISWIVTGFMICSTITTPTYGKLSDMYGRRPLFVVSIGIFLITSVLCGMAQTMGQLIVFRALQGLGAGGLLTLSQTVVSDVVSPQDRPRYQGVFTATTAVSQMSGPLVGGVLTAALSWRWVFYVNLPVGLLGLALLWFTLPRETVRKKHRIDFVGGLLLAATVTCALLLLSLASNTFDWASLPSIGLAALTVALLALFIVCERRAAEPVLDLSLFKIPAFTLGIGVSGAMTFAMYGTYVFLPYYFQVVLGLDPARAGLLMLPQIITMLITSILGGQIAARFGNLKALLLWGIAFQAIGLSSLAVLAWSGASIAPFCVAMGLLGLGMGVASPNATVIVQNSVDRSSMGMATGGLNFIRTLGGVVGVACSTAVVAARLQSGLAKDGLATGGLLTGDMSAIRSLGPEQAATALGAYRHAIATSFTVSGLTMCLVLLLASTVRHPRL